MAQGEESDVDVADTTMIVSGEEHVQRDHAGREWRWIPQQPTIRTIHVGWTWEAMG